MIFLQKYVIIFLYFIPPIILIGVLNDSCEFHLCLHQKGGVVLIELIFNAGLSSVFYFGFHILGYLAVLFFNIWYGKKYNIKPWKAVVTTIIVYAITYVWIYIQFWIESGFKNFGGNNIVRGFIYIPLIALPVARALKISWKRMCDFIAPCVCVSHGISHIGCIFEGCCKGFPSSWGIYNPWDKITLFPIQLFESITALLIVVVIVCQAKRKNFVSDGKSFPVMLIAFGGTRFLFEFARNNEKILLGCSSLAFHALFMVLIGVAVLLYIKLRPEKKNDETFRCRRGCGNG